MTDRHEISKDGVDQDQTVLTDREKSRRAALAKLGLAVTVAYATPTLIKLDRSAMAMGVSCVKNPGHKNCQ